MSTEESPDTESPDTVTAAIDLLRAEGYTTDFQLVAGVLRGEPDVACPVGSAEVERVYRFEGPSDPGDEMIVFGVRDPASGARGTVAGAFGPTADPELYEHLSDLHGRARA